MIAWYALRSMTPLLILWESIGFSIYIFDVATRRDIQMCAGHELPAQINLVFSILTLRIYTINVYLPLLDRRQRATIVFSLYLFFFFPSTVRPVQPCECTSYPPSEPGADDTTITVMLSKICLADTKVRRIRL